MLAAALPGFTPGQVDVIESGWDSVVLDVDDEWIVRVSRSPDLVYETEARLLEELRPLLPAPVPRFIRVGTEPVPFVVYAKLRGSAADEHVDDLALADALGRFLRALHAFPIARAEALGAQAVWRATHADRLAAVLPLLDPDERLLGGRLLDAYRNLHFEPTFVHADLSPEHVLCAPDGGISGVLDWSDAGIGDPAIDLAWILRDTPEAFAGGVLRAYGPDATLADRALVHARLRAWHTVVYGLEHAVTGLVAHGLVGVREELPPD